MRKIRQVDLCATWLTERLANGPVPAAEIYAEAKDKGFSEETLLNAAKRVDAVSESYRSQYGMRTRWYID